MFRLVSKASSFTKLNKIMNLLNYMQNECLDQVYSENY